MIKALIAKIKSAISDFRNGLSIIFGKPKEGKGDRRLAKICSIAEAQIPTYGKQVVRTQMIKSIEGDLKRAAKKGNSAIDALLGNALATPEYVALCRRLGLEEPHLKVMAMEAKKNAK